MKSEKVAKILEIQNKSVFGIPCEKLLMLKAEMEDIMVTMTKEEFEELFNARYWTPQFKIYVQHKFIYELKKEKMS